MLYSLRRLVLLSSVALAANLIPCFVSAQAQVVSAQAVPPVNHPAPGNYWYVKANQTTFQSAPVGVQSSMTIERPKVQGQVFGKHHSLAAMYIATANGDTIVNGVELGWAVAPNIYIDEEPHLFAFPVKGGNQQEHCWPDPGSCGWVPAPGAKHHLGEYLQPSYGSGAVKYFMILHQSDGNWWVLYDNERIGYFKGEYWGGTFTSGNITSWYGEVQNPQSSSGDCTAMGNGTYGTQSGAALIGALGYWTQDKSGFHETWAQPTESTRFGNTRFYNMGNHLSASFFTYGGPGGYVDRFGKVTTAC